MTSKPHSDVPAGWLGGFATSNPAFAYPTPNLTSLPLLGNMDNIEKLKRQQKVQFPEFSWETEPGNPDPIRCFQMFAPDISRLGYDDHGRVYSIICPQQGFVFPEYAVMNLEVTVTGQRGWVDEPKKMFAADLTVEGAIWFSQVEDAHWIIKKAWDYFSSNSLPFPSDKKHAIKVQTHAVGNPEQPFFSLRMGQSDLFEAPDFAQHPEAYAVSHLSVQMGTIKPSGHEKVDHFNQRVVDIFNLASGNFLQNKNVLTWNIWSEKPELVNTTEWQNHAEKWRKSIDANHGPVSNLPYLADHSVYEPAVDKAEEIAELFELLKDLI